MVTEWQQTLPEEWCQRQEIEVSHLWKTVQQIPKKKDFEQKIYSS